MALIVCSKSTREYAESIGVRIYQVEKPPTKDIIDIVVEEDEIIAIGGGAVMDTAKILAANSGIETVLCFPTTAAGAGSTSRAVYWDGTKKCSIKTPKPITMKCHESLRELPVEIILNTQCDAYSHALESLWSNKATAVSEWLALKALNMMLDGCPLVEAGNIAGAAIEITGTNIIHAMSYPLTGHYGIPHGQAIGILLPAIAQFMGYGDKVPYRERPQIIEFGIDMLAWDAMNYFQLHTSIKTVTKKDVIGLYERALL